MKKTAIIIVMASILIFFGCSATKQTSTAKKQTNINVASFNLRMDTQNDVDDAWPHRKEMVKGLVRFHDFDIFGTQEGFKHQLDDILELRNYAYVGAGRDDGKDAGEHSAIIYKKDRFEILENGDFWFSETPEVPSKGWDATCCNRICSWAKLRDRDSKKEFYFFNVHYDHEGQVARKNSSLMLLERIKKITSNYPVFVTGDFNATSDSEPIQTLAQDGKLLDSYLVTKEPPYGTTGTFNSFKLDSPMKVRIDYVWVTNDIAVNKYAVLNDSQYGHFPSDHFPVMINVTF